MARITPAMLLNRTLKESLETISTLSESGDFYKIFPPKIETPPYGDKWGRNANYIEINNRAIARMQKDKCSGGMLSAIKLLGAIPPSARSWANCVILSQLFPNIYGDGYNKAPWEENSLYGSVLHGLQRKYSASRAGKPDSARFRRKNKSALSTILRILGG